MTRTLANTLVLGLAVSLLGCDALSGAPSCDEVVAKAVETMVAAQGDNSLLKREHIARIAAGCEASGTMQSHTESAKCVLAAGDFETMKACPELDTMMKLWLKNSK